MNPSIEQLEAAEDAAWSEYSAASKHASALCDKWKDANSAYRNAQRAAKQIKSPLTEQSAEGAM